MNNDTLSQDEISTLVDVARMSGLDLNPTQRGLLDKLVVDGLIEAAGSRNGVTKYALTSRGQRALDQRGVGANES